MKYPKSVLITTAVLIPVFLLLGSLLVGILSFRGIELPYLALTLAVGGVLLAVWIPRRVYRSKQAKGSADHA